MLIESLRDNNKSVVLRSHNKISQVNKCSLNRCILANNNNIPASLVKGAYGVVLFKAQAPKTNFHKISFTANPLYDINLRKLIDADSYKNIRAKFSELIPKNEEDAWAILNIEDIWPKLGKTDYATRITQNFLCDNNPERSYFVTEVLDNSKELSNRITCLLETTNPKKAVNKDNFEVYFLQASPAIVNKVSAQVKGSGELSLYGAVKVAKENGFKKVTLVSTNDSFYDKMQFEKVEALYPKDEFPNKGGIYELSSDNYDAFLKKVADKYELK